MTVAEGGGGLKTPRKQGVRASFAHDNQMVINLEFGKNYGGSHKWQSQGGVAK